MTPFKHAAQTVIDIGREISSKRPGRSIIGVCGQGGVGKSTLCRAIVAESNYPCAIFEIDWYLTHSSSDRRSAVCKAISESSAELSFWRNPINWYDWESLSKDLLALRDQGCLRAASCWRQGSGEKDLEIAIDLPDNAVIFCDGIYLLHRPVIDWLDLIITLESSSEAALKRSNARDAHRNEQTYQKFKESVAKTFDAQYFAGNSVAADYILHV